MDPIFHDREAVTDVLVRGYMEYEPQLLWVVECEGRIAGYLTGCLDTKAFNRPAQSRVIRKAVLRAIARGALLHVRTWRLLGAFAATVLLGGFPLRIDLIAYPAHFHINLEHRFRGRGFGRRLADAFMQQVVRAGIGGIHVVARGDNPTGRRFFEVMGFKLVSERPLILPEGRWFKKVSTVVYGWRREG